MESQLDQILKRHFLKHPLSTGMLLDQFPDLDSSHLEATYAIGSEFFKIKKYKQAEDIFYFLATMNQYEVRYWKALAVTLFAQKKYRDAIGVYLAVYFLSPDDIEVLSAMADCCLHLGDKKGAREFLEQVCEVFKEEKKREDLAKRARGLLDVMDANEKKGDEEK